MMIWLRLFWWVLWRGIVSGAALGAALGTVILIPYAFASTLFVCGYGFFVGAAVGGGLGLILGILDGILLTTVTWWRFDPANAPPRDEHILKWVIGIVNTIGGYIALERLMNDMNFFLLIAVVVATVAALHYVPAYTDYAARELAAMLSADMQQRVLYS